MKIITTFLGTAVLTAGIYRTGAQSTGVPPADTTPPAAVVAANASLSAPYAIPPTAAVVPAPATPAVSPADVDGTNDLRLNFRGAPLDSVLDYLSDAAGFIIVLDTQVSGRVDLWSDQPVTRDEAVDLLNSVLNKNGYAAIRDGRKLTIMEQE